ncbi:MAG TPA: hypothetical protein PK648_04360, partial [Verrucomicrobiales bacterium]|nr:hypothetical protein [Verrucomicrobiales bacterium]
ASSFFKNSRRAASQSIPLALSPLQTYYSETGEVFLCGQDLDRYEKLVPGKNRIVKMRASLRESRRSRRF